MLNKKIFNSIVLAYIIVQLLLFFSGLSGNTDPIFIQDALKYFTPDDIANGRLFFTNALAPRLIYRLLQIFILLILIYKIPFNIKISSSLFINFFINISLIQSILVVMQYPFACWGNFYRLSQFKLMNASFGVWSGRYFLSALISLFITSVVIAIILTVIKKFKYYFVIIPVGVLLVSYLFILAYPYAITPLFYKITPLTNEALGMDLKNLAKEEGITISEIYTIDQSRFTGQANAYMTGIGSEKKIFLYDTLLKNYSNKEIISIFAHELNHYKEEHVLISICLSALSVLILLLIYHFLLDKKLMIRDKIDLKHSAEIILAVIIVSFFLSPPINAVSRIYETRSDNYQLKLTDDKDTIIRMEQKLARQNYADILPDTLTIFFYYSHPQILDRIKAASK